MNEYKGNFYIHNNYNRNCNIDSYKKAKATYLYKHIDVNYEQDLKGKDKTQFIAFIEAQLLLIDDDDKSLEKEFETQIKEKKKL
jgi:hypothetical protein